MTTVKKMKDAEKAALEDQLKYYTGLIAAHYSSANIQTQHPNAPSHVSRNPVVSAYSTFKTTTNHVHHYKSSSFQSRSVNHLRNQNAKTVASFNLHRKRDLPFKTKVSNSFDMRKYPCKSSMVKINPSSVSLNQTEKALEPNILLKKNLHNSQKQINPVVVNKSSGSDSQVLMNEIGALIEQMKKKTASSKIHALNKYGLDKPELKVKKEIPTNSKIFCNTLNDMNQTKDSNQISQENSSNDVNDSLVKSLSEVRNNFVPPSNHKTLEIPIKSFTETSEKLCLKLENPDDLQVNNTVKTPAKKKLTRKRTSSVKKLSGTKLFASKYKVVNKKLPCVQHVPMFKKVTLLSSEVKTPLKVRPIRKHINSGKKMKSAARLITTKYKIINKKLPCIQTINSEISFQGQSRDVAKLPIDKWASLKTNETKSKVKKLNSKYKIVNKSEKSVIVPISLFAKRNISTKESKLGNFVYQRSKNPNEFNTSNSSRKIMYATSKLYGDRKIIKNMGLLKQNHLHVLNLKRNKHNHSQNSCISNSKYRTVNKHPSSSLKKISERVKSSNLSINHNSSIDLDLLMELAAEKKDHNDDIIKNSPNKHVLIKRVYKSKNAIVNKNICSLQTKAARMIKTKYSILNKKHSWQRQSFTKRIVSPKSFKGQKFNSYYERKSSFFHSQRNSRNNSRHNIRHHFSTYFAGRSYSKTHLVSKDRTSAVGSLQSVVKTPRRFVLNRKVYLKTPNTMKSVVPMSQAMASRVLNRSINRVLTASVKKKTSKLNKYCMFYNRFGRCNKGIKCPFVHDPSKIAVCTRFLRGTCKNENCLFSHEICPGKMAICSFYLLGSCTKIDCPYRHETLSPNAKLCKAFVQGYCPDGKQCKQAHVLVCPQFVQGHCEKGNACPFPHPPSKEKKTSPNSVEKNENLEETEEQILEKMSRYFECANESPTSDKCSITVPRIRNLPEQPSFIAL